MQAVGQIDGSAARAAVGAAGARVSALLRSVQHPDAPAVGTWNLTDVAVHLSHVVDAIHAMAQGGGGLIQDIWGLSKLTEALVKGETDRDLSRLADRIDASVAAFLAGVEAAADEGPRQWVVQGMDVTLSTLTCHILNELTVHGRDIALAEGVPWPIERSHAGLIVCGFLFPAISVLRGTMVNQEAAAGVRVCFDIRVRGGGRAYWTFDNGDLTITSAPPGRADCHLLVEPAAFLLVAWDRISQWQAIPRGQLLAWGRKPWMGLKLRSLMRNP